MKRLSTVLSVLALATAAVGCGASAPARDRASIPQHRWTEADWYADAFGEAVSRYEAEVELAASYAYDSEVEARAVAAAHGEPHFRAHLTAALHERGLTPRGLRVFVRHHPEFESTQRALYEDRMTDIRRTAARITERVDPDVRPVAAFPSEGESPTRVASRD
ncbi:MAG TPA: hypothetical protein RMH99_21280 [Sandaracinaceae bacterium LLY-WYZ-13_1]|nr:hypothetical protein [Sandaracinaceae bacterium LLY-WYZ-13_1]